jgi:hypothetical protein
MRISSKSMPLNHESLTVMKNESNGGMIALYDSHVADAWINANYDHECVVSLREHHVGGPVASMLSLESPALSIFGPISASLVDMACDLADVSGFPVIIRPHNEDPSDRFRYEGEISSVIMNDQPIHTEIAGYPHPVALLQTRKVQEAKHIHL